MTTSPERFFAATLHGSAPLLVWALHFFGAYVLVAAGCCRAGDASLRTLLLLGSALAIGAIAWQLRGTAGASDRLLRSARLGGGVLALVGVAWTTLPMFVLPVCRCG